VSRLKQEANFDEQLDIVLVIDSYHISAYIRALDTTFLVTLSAARISVIVKVVENEV
jgi:hypothetical protein